MDGQSDHSSQSPLDSIVFTLDPKAKYGSPRPSMHGDVVQEPGSSTTILSDTPQRSDVLPPPTRSTPVDTLQPLERARPRTSQGLCITFPKASSIRAIFCKMRGTRSAPGAIREGDDNDSRPVRPLRPNLDRLEQHKSSTYHEMKTDRLHSQIRAPVNTPDWPLAATSSQHVLPWTSNSSTNQYFASTTSSSFTNHSLYEPSTPVATQPDSSEESLVDLVESINSEDQRSMTEFNPSIRSTRLNQPNFVSEMTIPVSNVPWARAAKAAEHIGNDAQQASHQNSKIEEDCLGAVHCAASPWVLPFRSKVPSSTTSQSDNPYSMPCTVSIRSKRPSSLKYDNGKSLSTYYTTGSFLDGPLSPHYLSQPESPSVRDFDEAWETGSQTRPSSDDKFLGTPLDTSEVRKSSSFHASPPPSPSLRGYSIADPDHSSTVTLRKPASVKLSPPQEVTDQGHPVQSWKKESPQVHVTALDELVDDLGYLGQMIH